MKSQHVISPIEEGELSILSGIKRKNADKKDYSPVYMSQKSSSF